MSSRMRPRTMFKGGQRGGLPAHLVLKSPASDAYNDYDHEQQAGQDDEITNVQ